MAINLGDINFGLGPDTRRLDAARRSVLQFGQAVNRAARDQSDGARRVESDLRRQEKAMLSALQSTLKLNQAIRQTSGNERLIQQTTNAYNRLVKEMSNGQQTALQFQRSQEDFAATVGRVSRALGDEQVALRRSTQARREVERQSLQTQRVVERATQQQIRLAFDAAKAQEQGILRQNSALSSAEMAVIRYNSAVQRLKASQRDAFAHRGDAALQVLRTQLDQAGSSMIRFQQAQQTFRRSMAEATSQMALFRVQAGLASQTGLEAALRRLADVSILLHGPLSGVAARLVLISSLSERVNLATAAMVVGISAGVYAFYRLGQGAISAARELERIDQALTGLHGAQVLAAADMKYLMELADRSGAQFQIVAQQYTRLTAASKGTNLEGERTREIFENILFAAQKMGSSNEELAGTLKAIEQIMSKGKVQAEELRQQLGDRLPGAVQIMAQALGLTTAELSKMMEQGKLTSDALLAFAETAAQRLGVDTTQAIDNVVAAENRLSNALFRFNTQADRTIKFSNAYKSALRLAADALGWFGDNLDNVVRVFGAASGAIAATLAVMYAPALIAGLSTVLGLIKGLTVAFLGLNTAIMANPLGAVATLLIRVGAAAAGAVGGFQLLNMAIGDTGQSHFDALPGVRAFIDAQDTLKSSIRATTQEYITQQEVLMQSLRAQFNIAQAEARRAEEMLARWEGINVANDPVSQQAAAAARQPLLDSIQREKDLFQDLTQSYADLIALRDILNRQSESEGGRVFDPFGGGDSDESAKKRVDFLKDFDQKIKLQELDIELMGQGTYEITRQRTALEMLHQAQQTGISITPDLLNAIEERANKTAYLTEKIERLNQVEQDGQDLFKAGQDAISGVIKAWAKGEDVLDSVLSKLGNIGDMLIDMAVRNLFANAFPIGGSALGAFGGGAGGLFGGFLIPGILHEGGRAGSSGYGHSRSFPASMWAGAPRYHKGTRGAGLRSGEIPAILRRGEVVDPGDGSIFRSVFGGSGGGGSNVSIQIIDQRTNAPPVHVSHERDSAGNEHIRIMINEQLDAFARNILPKQVSEITKNERWY